MIEAAARKRDGRVVFPTGASAGIAKVTVLVDTRGYIYVSGGAQQGLYILHYTGPRK